MSKKARFIVIEGLDGSGKSTLTRHLKAILEEKKQQKVLTTYEPNDPSCGGDFIRDCLTKKITEFDPRVLALAFAANRLDHNVRTIKPWLAQGDDHIVLCDRYYFSSLVYQSSPDFSFERVMELNEKAMQPDLFFFLNVSDEVCYQRMNKRDQPRELFEQNLGETRQKFMAALDFLKKRGETIHEIDGSGTVEKSVAQVLAYL